MILTKSRGRPYVAARLATFDPKHFWNGTGDQRRTFAPPTNHERIGASRR